MTPTSRERRRPGVRSLAAATLVGALLLVPTVAFAAGDDPNLDQDLGDQAVVTGQRVLDAGHVDMGPKFVDGRWTFLIHDDVAKADAGATSVWRYPDETVLHVLDESQLVVPDDPAYAFVGAEPGATVWVVPQTQDPAVVWLGWNTQDPEVMTTIDRGVTLSLTGVQGPGALTVYLQSGSFGEPQVLFDSRVTDSQPVWVDVNTHTHANWVFTAPGVYLVQVRADADLIDGSAVSDTQVIRVAVGTATAPADAFAASWEGGVPAGPDEEEVPDDQAVAPPESERDPLVAVLVGAIVVVGLALVAAVVVMVVRGNRAKRRILTSRAAASPAQSSADARGAR